MTSAGQSVRAVLISLWLRLLTVAVTGSLFAAAVLFREDIAAWRFYQNIGEVVFELLVRVIFVALIGATLGSICTAALVPFLLYHESSRQRIAQVAVRSAVGAVVFIDFFIALKVVLTAIVGWAGLLWFPTVIIFTSYCVAFAIILGVRRRREQLLTSLDGILEEKVTRRAAMVTGIASVALVAAELTLAKTASAKVVQARVARPGGPNILLITFDALSAEDMSLYGYRLPTTPHIDEFARGSSVFTNFYSASTFTTPGIATILTGLQPSENLVYHLQGRLRGDYAEKTLPHMMRAGGYSTGASISNPYAHFLVEGVAEYDTLPDAPSRAGGFERFWDATKILHERLPFGSRAREFMDLQLLWDYPATRLKTFAPRFFDRTESECPPGASFAQAKEVLQRLPEGFFLWVHVVAPHGPYLPDPPFLGRFLPSGEMRTAEQQVAFAYWPRYEPDKQHLVDKARLRYDEFIMNADDAFGVFLSGLEAAGRLRDTAVIVAADHGESFEGGLYTHASRLQTRPEIHIPLIVRMPGQEHGSRIDVTADQTALAPTLLEIAGLPQPAWMHGKSLLPWLNRDHEGDGEGLAFTQYLAISSIFEPVRAGTVGVIDGRHQYVLDLASGKGILRGLAEAQLWDCDRSAENPELAKALRAAIYSRFPHLPRKPA